MTPNRRGVNYTWARIIPGARADGAQRAPRRLALPRKQRNASPGRFPFNSGLCTALPTTPHHAWRAGLYGTFAAGREHLLARTYTISGAAICVSRCCLSAALASASTARVYRRPCLHIPPACLPPAVARLAVVTHLRPGLPGLNAPHAPPVCISRRTLTTTSPPSVTRHRPAAYRHQLAAGSSRTSISGTPPAGTAPSLCAAHLSHEGVAQNRWWRACANRTKPDAICIICPQIYGRAVAYAAMPAIVHVLGMDYCPRRACYGLFCTFSLAGAHRNALCILHSRRITAHGATSSMHIFLPDTCAAALLAPGGSRRIHAAAVCLFFMLRHPPRTCQRCYALASPPQTSIHFCLRTLPACTFMYPTFSPY